MSEDYAQLLRTLAGTSGKDAPALWDAATAYEVTAPVLREIALLALAEGATDFAWVVTFLNPRMDFATGAHFTDEELARLAAGENIRMGIRELARRGLLELRIEREGRPSMSWSVFVPEAD